MQSPQAPTPVLVTLTPSQVNIAPGSPPAEMAISVRNGGPTVDQYGIEIEGLEPGWSALDVQSLSLFPGDSFDGKLTLRVPQGSRPVAGAYPFTVRVRSRSNPEISGFAQGLARVGQGAAARTTQAGRGRRSLWPLLLLASVAVVVLAVVAYLVLGNPRGTSRTGTLLTPSPTGIVAQNILPTQTLPPLASPTPEASASPLVQATVCGTWAIDHRLQQDTLFPPGIADHGPFQVAGQQYKYRADYTSVLYVNATGIISTVRVTGLDVFKSKQNQPEVISATLVSPTNMRVPLFVWACNPGSLVSLHVTLDDSAKTGIPYSCSQNMSGTYKPDGSSLSSLKDQPAQGNWIVEMSVYSNEEHPINYFNSWGLAICTRSPTP